MLCERCGAEMYRMHAVWRCSSCGFKTDCCGW
jgi:ribosomal protein L37E